MTTQHKLIVGIGKTGISCARYCRRRNIPFIVYDTRVEPSNLSEFRHEFPDISLHLACYPDNLLQQVDEIIVSPGVALTEPLLIAAKQANIPIIGDIEIFARNITAPLAAITGTNAKGTVCTLLTEMAECADKRVLLGGNIGTPVLDLLEMPQPELYVLELSSFQLETTYSLKPTVATILNISDDHLDRHKTLQGYIAAKQRIYTHCEKAIYNRDDKATYPQMKIAQLFSFGVSAPADDHELGLQLFNNENWLMFNQQKLLNAQQLLIRGRHNWLNSLAALALGYALHLPWSAMLQALRNFKGLPHRCEWVASQNNVVWYNDSKGTNVGATLAAIIGLGQEIVGKIILIAGGLSKDADLLPLRQPASQYLRTAILIGQDAPLLEKALTGAVTIEHATSLAAAVAAAKQAACPGDVVLLSPACASWDMFRDYEQRGEIFKRCVKELLT